MYPRPPDVCLVFLNTWAAESYDRESLLVDWNVSNSTRNPDMRERQELTSIAF